MFWIGDDLGGFWPPLLLEILESIFLFKELVVPG